MKKQFLIASAGALLLVVFAVASFLYDKQRTNAINEIANKNTSLLIRAHSPVTGDENAKVTIVEFFDPACETCKKFHLFVKQLMASNPGKIKLVMRYTPFHKGSDYVVKILGAAQLQNKFWETLEAAYAAQPDWAAHGNPQPEKIWMRLGNVNLKFKQAKNDMLSPAIAKQIQQDMADARLLQVTKTPSFFVNGKPLSKFGYKQLKELVEAEIRIYY